MESERIMGPVPEGFLWLVFGAAALGLLIGGGGGWRG